VITLPEVTIVGDPTAPPQPSPASSGGVVEGIDYVWGNFEEEAKGAASLGGSFVCRYLSYDKGKNLMRAEADKWAAPPARRTRSRRSSQRVVRIGLPEGHPPWPKPVSIICAR
jgi:hypothetical protein